MLLNLVREACQLNDSLSVIRVLRKNINGVVLKFDNDTIEIMVTWIPSHVGILGNEFTDSTATRH